MRIGSHKTMARKMFADGHHTRFFQAQHEVVRQFCNSLRHAVEGTVANDFAGAVI